MTKVTLKTKFKNCCMSYTIKSPMELNYMLFLTRKYLCCLDKYSGCVAEHPYSTFLPLLKPRRNVFVPWYFFQNEWKCERKFTVFITDVNHVSGM